MIFWFLTLWTAFWMFVFFSTSAPVGLTTWSLDSAWVLDFALCLPLPIKRLLCGGQQNCWCVLEIKSFPQASALALVYWTYVHTLQPSLYELYLIWHLRLFVI